MAVRKWTDKEKQNAMTYGVCWVCREPLEARLSVETKDGEEVWTHGIVCPNCHPR